MVTIGGTTIRIDPVEVSYGDYFSFTASGFDPTQQPSYCQWNLDFMPSGAPTGQLEAKQCQPVTLVDWCDAWSYCAWAGKRLCTADDNTAIGEWYEACSSGGTSTFPYGDSYQATTCNGFDYEPGESGEPLSWEQATQCVASNAPIRHMSGNVWEWAALCSSETGQNDECVIRGGSFRTGETQLRCDAQEALPRNKVLDEVGFRCCAD